MIWQLSRPCTSSTGRGVRAAIREACWEAGVRPSLTIRSRRSCTPRPSNRRGGRGTLPRAHAPALPQCFSSTRGAPLSVFVHTKLHPDSHLKAIDWSGSSMIRTSASPQRTAWRKPLDRPGGHPIPRTTIRRDGTRPKTWFFVHGDSTVRSSKSAAPDAYLPSHLPFAGAALRVFPPPHGVGSSNPVP